MRLAIAGEEVELDPSGAAFWLRERVLVVADLHLEKGSAFARRGSFLPPYDTEATLGRLEAVIERLRPTTVVSLGDAFHDRAGPRRLPPGNFDRLRAVVDAVRWAWVLGNHDPSVPVGLGGAAVAELGLGGLCFRHVPTGGHGEIAGHLHPKAKIAGRRLRLSRPCFISDGARLILPAFGIYAGGLNALDAAIAGLFPGGYAAYLLGEARVFEVPHGGLLPEADARRHTLAEPP